MPSPAYKHALEIPNSIKLAFLAGAAMGTDAYRNGTPLRTMAAIDQIGNLCMAALFTKDLLPSDPTEAAIEFFDSFWTSCTTEWFSTR